MRAFTLALLFSVSFLEISAQRYEATFKNEPAVSALKTVIKTYNLKVSYSSSHLRSYKISKVVVANDPEQFLKDLLRGLPFSVKTNQNFILIAPTDQVVPTLGKVVDADTDAPLAFVLIQADTQTIVTDKNGSFRLKPSKDSIELVFSYLGYKKKTTVVSPNTESLVIALEQKPTVLQEVVLNGGAQQGLFTAPSSFSLNPRK
ncbi:MAG: carboxypeptidase-like regulatory domain-containing protein, partial [Bacteroidota bacterium]